MYGLIRRWLFRFEAERAHELVMAGLAYSAHHPGALTLIRAACEHRDPRLEIERFGITFPTPIGLAAGFDKNALAVPSWAALGFGFIEIGSVTAQPQPGNPRPRMFRLPSDRAVINRMGFNNDGAEVVAARLARWRRLGVPVPLGVNVGKSKVVPLAEARDDYSAALAWVWPYADYLVLNVSSPNTPGLRELQEASRLDELLELIAELRAEHGRKPVLLKLGPDLSDAQLDAVVSTCEQRGIEGLIATNTTLSRRGLRPVPAEAGGLSGRPLRARSLEVLRYLRSRTELPIVSVGGVETVSDVVERLRAGASLLQLYTAYIYHGPGLLRALGRGLGAYLEREGLDSVEQLIGRSG